MATLTRMLLALALFTVTVPSAFAHADARTDDVRVRYRTVKVGEVDVVYREAGGRTHP